jgi:predicted DNA-binding protein (MmcQ/YjbR family)
MSTGYVRYFLFGGKQMNLEHARSYLLAKQETTEERPFGPEALVYKVMGKMFAIIAWESNPLQISLKCDPNDALALRDMYTAVQPGYHLNKRHWNTVVLDDTIPQAEIWHMIDHSYELVVKGLPKRDQKRLNT